MAKIQLYDTTLRDGTQMQGISLSANDKIKIAIKLNEFGIHFIEGGWPGSNPKDIEFFQQAKDLPFFKEKVTAFTSTRYKDTKAEDDKNLQEVLNSGVSTVTIFGKTWDLHVHHALQTTLEENLNMIADSVAFFKEKGKRVIYDAEHLFDGFKENEEYALETLKAAEKAGADIICLCDTNGGSLPEEIQSIIKQIQKIISTPLGIHPHNDSDLAVANALAAVELGVNHIQGTINGYGERVGNANLCSIIPNLQLKLGHDCIPEENLKLLTPLSHYVSEIANLSNNPQLPFVGINSFAHKGGIHVSAMARDTRTYQHIEPTLIGNQQHTLISELAGKSNIIERAKTLGIEITEEQAKRVVLQIKHLEKQGFQFESADASFQLLIKRQKADYTPPFIIKDYLVLVEKRGAVEMTSEAIVKVQVGKEIHHTAAEGNGPVNALDAALRKALINAYPSLQQIKLHDYKVRILDETEGTSANVRVLIESGTETHSWSTVGSSPNIIEASFYALVDSLEYGILSACN
ncbi:MAG: citramalate synthase [bacterium]